MTLKPASENDWDFAKEFIATYQQEFGFTLHERPIIVDDIRIRGIGHSLKTSCPDVYAEIASLKLATPPAESISSTAKVYFEGGRLDCPVYLLERLPIGSQIFGPALIIDAHSTIVVAPGCSAISTSEHLVITVGSGKKAIVTAELDPIQLSIFSHR